MLNWALPSALCLIPYLNTHVYISIISFQNSFVIVPACSFVIIHFSSKNSDINVIIMLSTDLFISFIYFKESCLLLFFLEKASTTFKEPFDWYGFSRQPVFCGYKQNPHWPSCLTLVCCQFYRRYSIKRRHITYMSTNMIKPLSSLSDVLSFPLNSTKGNTSTIELETLVNHFIRSWIYLFVVIPARTLVYM